MNLHDLLRRIARIPTSFVTLPCPHQVRSFLWDRIPVFFSAYVSCSMSNNRFLTCSCIVLSYSAWLFVFILFLCMYQRLHGRSFVFIRSCNSPAPKNQKSPSGGLYLEMNWSRGIFMGFSRTTMDMQHPTKETISEFMIMGLAWGQERIKNGHGWSVGG